ncbi:MAG: hypothetical protein QM704_10070 [Anaeromyxobacteraceae bacterium]
MAVKVMVASAIVKGDTAKPAPAPRREAAATPKPKRRRSAVYDADGNEVLITLMCQKCHKMRPLSLFGLRKMSDGTIRNQPWCRSCRSGAGTGKGKETSQAEESPTSGESPLDGAPSIDADAPATPARRNPAAEIAAALAAGRG